jgi:hypothetical protein
MAKVAKKKAVKKAAKAEKEPRAKAGGTSNKSTAPTEKAAGRKTAKKATKAKQPTAKTAKPAKKAGAKTAPTAAKKRVGTAKRTKLKTASAPAKKAAPTKKQVTASKTTARKQTSRRTAPGKNATVAKAPVKKASGGKALKLNVDQVIKEFRSVVNLKPDQLERWLSMPDSKKLGFKDEVKAGTRGHESGKRILKILSKRRDKYTEDDLRHMETVVGFVRHHRREKPPGDVFASNWRYSLMNWGHDPMK